MQNVIKIESQKTVTVNDENDNNLSLFKRLFKILLERRGQTLASQGLHSLNLTNSNTTFDLNHSDIYVAIQQLISKQSQFIEEINKITLNLIGLFLSLNFINIFIQWNDEEKENKLGNDKTVLKNLPNDFKIKSNYKNYIICVNQSYNDINELQSNLNIGKFTIYNLKYSNSIKIEIDQIISRIQLNDFAVKNESIMIYNSNQQKQIENLKSHLSSVNILNLIQNVGQNDSDDKKNLFIDIQSKFLSRLHAEDFIINQYINNSLQRFSNNSINEDYYKSLMQEYRNNVNSTDLNQIRGNMFTVPNSSQIQSHQFNIIIALIIILLMCFVFQLIR